MKILCPAKINLFLNVLEKKENMHELLLINQTVDLYDEIELSINKTNNIVIESEDSIPKDETNSIFKAAKILKENYKIEEGLTFKVKKHIPQEAGLGGESTDAAGTLLLLNEYFHLNITKQELITLGIKIGSDVPFFIKSGYQKVTSIGDKVKKMNTKNPYNCYIIIKPNFGLSTKEMFQEIDKLPFKKERIKIPYNDFMKVVPKEILKIKDYLNHNKIKNHTLSGSGSTYYIALPKEDKELYQKIKNHYKDYIVLNHHNCDGYIIKES